MCMNEHGYDLECLDLKKQVEIEEISTSNTQVCNQIGQI